MGVRLPDTVLMILLSVSSTAAGQGPLAPGSVTVLPDGDPTPMHQSNTGGYSQMFIVRNNYASTQTYQLTCFGRNNVTCTGTQFPQVTLGPGIQDELEVTYNVGDAHPDARLVLLASGAAADTGYYTVSIAPIGLRAVAVRPELPERQHFANAGGSQRFFVKNLQTVSATYALTGVCSGTTTGCGVAPASVILTPGESKVATLTYTVGDSGTAGSGMVKAIDAASSGLRDSASVTLRSVAPAFPLVSIVDVNPGTTIERDQCLTIAAGSAAAFECGDLRIVHALPAIRTLNKPRVPTLLYNSAAADPYPIVAASVTLGNPSPWPDSVEAVLKVGGVVMDSGRWAGADWYKGTTQRIALRAALKSDTATLGDTTKVVDYTLEVATITLGGSRRGTTVAGRLIVVNRRRSSFGAGWWLAGLERLTVLTDSSRLWVGGDGSARVYAPAGANTWVAPRVDRPDTLTRVGQRYVRRLPGGVSVWFSSAGLHDTTINRLGHKTSFTYANGQLATITLPSQGGGQTYTFGYPGNLLTTVTAPGPRVTTIRISAQRVDSIRDPDNATVRFSYENPSSRRITSRVDRRGAVTSYSYDAAKKLWRSHVALPGDSIRLGFRANAVQGLLSATPKTATDTAAVYTSFFGARQFTTGPNFIAQETRFWVDRFGAPRRIVNPLGHQTLVKREDGEWTALATELVAPSNFVTRAGYDGRGNVVRSTAVNPLGDPAPGPEDDAVTRYHWDVRWDFADSLVTPAGVVTTLAYDTLTGNRVWQQVGSDAARRVTFAYYTTGKEAGLLRATQAPNLPGASAARDSVVYDTSRVNLAATRTPRGFWTSFYKDALGRDTLVVSPVDSVDKTKGGSNAARIRQRTVYDVMDQDTLVQTIAPALAGVQEQTITVRQTFDFEGNPLTVARQSSPDPAPTIGWITTTWRYDSAGRKRVEVAPDGGIDSTVFDAAGNAVEVRTRRHATISMRYDALNRQIERGVPGFVYPERVAGIATMTGRTPINRPYPYYLDGASIPRDSATFAYNQTGEMVRADNGDAWVRRAYYPSGLVAAETSYVRTVTSGNMTQHKYITTYRYDISGRRRAVKYPEQLAPIGKDSVRFAYDAQTGELTNVWDLLGNSFRYHYNLRGDMDTLYLPGGLANARTYDPDGNLLADAISSGLRNTVFRYDARQKILWSANSYGARDTLTAAYSGVGHLVTSRVVGYGLNAWSQDVRTQTDDTLANDALGNLRQTAFARRNRNTVNGQTFGQWGRGRSNTYQPGTGRLLSTVNGAQDSRDTSEYDPAGNVTFTWQVAFFPGQTPALEDRMSFYGLDGKVRAADYRWADNPQADEAPIKFVFEEYRYDALGRRVWVRARRDCDRFDGVQNGGTLQEQCRWDLVRRTVWDGALELAEIQMPGGDLEPFDNDTATLQRLATNGFDPNPFFGRVLYTHGTSLDQPLSLTRLGYSDLRVTPWVSWQAFSIVPRWTAMREADGGGFGAGAPPCQQVNGVQRCVQVYWPYAWSALNLPELVPRSWHGTSIEGKRDMAQTLYRRNRVYDPVTGRFTQEDPIGLAGGLNLYGFANGDPVNLSDPFGLCPPCYVAFEAAATLYDVGDLGVTTYKAARGKTSWGAVGVTALGVGIGFVSFGGGYGALARRTITRVDGLLREGGELIGRAGSRSGIREVTGGVDDARAMFNKLAEGGKVRPHPEVDGGLLAELPGGGTVGFRPVSKSGPATVDVNVRGVAVEKIKFVPTQAPK